MERRNRKGKKKVGEEEKGRVGWTRAIKLWGGHESERDESGNEAMKRRGGMKWGV